ncbi:ubiquitin carboxyl-terminal hydrolase 1-like isoform X2 [Acropora muricata]|uniref:ubiquitin carboxyl-terminal hydrolase 1-like isoform X2 n=1 Tax=Acropora muricata TaxID=159855 RepID=UPI0034E379FE
MPSVSQCHSPPPSPKSPPRKKTKFSLQRKKKTASTSDYDRDKRDKLFPLFTSPATRNASDDEVFEPPKPPPPCAGLVNHGNICYANAVLQVLRHCPGLIESVLAIDSHLTKVHPKLVVPETNNNEKADDSSSQGEDRLVSGNGSDHEPVACGLKELFIQMKDLEENYSENKENCEHLLSKKHSLVLAAKPLDFMEMFRKQNPMFEDNLQHDAQEFLCSLLVSLQDTEKEILKRTDNTSQHSSPFEDLFHGQLLHQTKCLTCEEAKKRYESFQDVSVPIQKEAKVNDPKAFSPTPKKAQDSESLLWALSQFARIEHLSGDNKYFCENCLTHTEAEISTSFEKLPKILIIHLKRFTANPLSGFPGFVSKINTNLATPMELTISEWCSKTCIISNPTYHLFGIVMHSGMTSCSGHYQAYVMVPTPNDTDFNNSNGHTSHQDNYQQRNESNVNSVGESSQENERQPLANTATSVSSNTFCKDDGNSSETPEVSTMADESDIPSLQNSAEKAKTSCMSGISRYFQRTRKYSKLENNEGAEDSFQASDLTESKRHRCHSTPCFKGISKSLNKIQSFQHRGLTATRNAVRQLNFQDSKRQGNSETNHLADLKNNNNLRLSHTSLPESHYQWVHFDDAEVTILQESDVTALLSSSESSFTSPYLLFYKLV